MKSVAKGTAVVAVGAAIGALTYKLILSGEAANSADARVRNIAKSMGLFGDQSDAVAERLNNLADNGDVGDVPFHAMREFFEVLAGAPDVGIADSARLPRGDELVGHLGGGADSDKVGTVGGVESDDIRDGDLTGGSAGAHPFVHGGSQGDPESGGEILAVAKHFQIPFGSLVAGVAAIRQPDGDLMRDQAGLFLTGEVTEFPLPALLPVEGIHGVSIFAIHRVDLHPARAGSDLHDNCCGVCVSGSSAPVAVSSVLEFFLEFLSQTAPDHRSHTKSNK
jgi:hypothetical protein